MKILKAFKDSPKLNGWWFSTNVGTYGTDYLQRALVAAFGLERKHSTGCYLSRGMQDADGKELDAASTNYVIHFDKGMLPRVNGFWSVTMYDKDFFFVPKSLNVKVTWQREASQLVGGSQAKFIPNTRLYWPKETPPSIIDGTWKPPAITVAR